MKQFILMLDILSNLYWGGNIIFMYWHLVKKKKQSMLFP